MLQIEIICAYMYLTIANYNETELFKIHLSKLLAKVLKQYFHMILYPLHLIQNGLRLTLNLDVVNYISLLSSDLGVRAVVHHPSVVPIPEEEGFSVSPGFQTSIGIRRVNTLIAYM